MEDAFLSTDELSERERLPFWREAVCETFVELDCESASRDRFFGSIRNSSVDDIQFSDVNSAAQHVRRSRSRIARSSKDYFLLSLQIRGQGVIAQDGRTAILQPGDFALYDTTRPYDLQFDANFRQLVLRLPRKIVTGRLADAEQHTAMRILGTKGAGRLASCFLRQLHAQIDDIDPLSVARLHASSVDLVATALAEQAGARIQVSEAQLLMKQRICAFIDAHLAHPELSCASVAAYHGISERYLRKLFQGSSMSVSELIWSRRLDQARRDLADPLRSHISVTAIAYDVGFKDSAHFSRAFKNRFGLTPGECRSQARVARLATPYLSTLPAIN